jgi:hypothetical protein
MTVKCPRCGRESPFDAENPFRPFCSERCKLVDLGQWASGKYRVPVSGNEQEDKIPSPPGHEPPES